jgi:hypothetical protein
MAHLCENCQSQKWPIYDRWEFKCPDCGLVFQEYRFNNGTAYLGGKKAYSFESYPSFTWIGTRVEREYFNNSINYSRLARLQNRNFGYLKDGTRSCYRQNLINEFKRLNTQYGLNLDVFLLTKIVLEIKKVIPKGSKDHEIEILADVVYYLWAKEWGFRIMRGELDLKNKKVFRIVKRVHAANIIKKSINPNSQNLQKRLIMQWCGEYRISPEIIPKTIKLLRYIPGTREMRAAVAFLIGIKIWLPEVKLKPYQFAKSIHLTTSQIYLQLNSLAKKLGYQSYREIYPKLTLNCHSHPLSIEIVN